MRPNLETAAGLIVSIVVVAVALIAAFEAAG